VRARAHALSPRTRIARGRGQAARHLEGVAVPHPSSAVCFRLRNSNPLRPPHLEAGPSPSAVRPTACCCRDFSKARKRTLPLLLASRRRRGPRRGRRALRVACTCTQRFPGSRLHVCSHGEAQSYSYAPPGRPRAEQACRLKRAGTREYPCQMPAPQWGRLVLWRGVVPSIRVTWKVSPRRTSKPAPSPVGLNTPGRTPGDLGQSPCTPGRTRCLPLPPHSATVTVFRASVRRHGPGPPCPCPTESIPHGGRCRAVR
jgi:hypothetical protein